MPIRFTFLVSGFVLAAAFLLGSAPRSSAEHRSNRRSDDDRRLTAMFQKSARFLEKHCMHCHSAVEQEGQFQLEDLITQEFNPAENKRWMKIVEMVSIGEMPPTGQPQPDKSERMAFELAVNRMLEEFGVGKNAWEAELPQYANRVDHESLFNGQHTGPAYTPSRIWRINESIYYQLMQDLDLGRDFVVPLQANDEGFRDYSQLLADEATIRTMMQNAKRAADAIMHGRLVKPAGAGARNKSNKPYRRGGRYRVINDFLRIEGEPSRQQARDVAAFVTESLLNRFPSEEELDQSVSDMLIPSIEASGTEEGLRGYIVSVLLSPEFLFRCELGLGEPLPDGRRMLTPDELAYAISYTLHDHPVESLLQAANEGRLETREDVEREFRALYDDPKLMRGRMAVGSKDRVWAASKPYDRPTKPRLLRFFQEYFEYTKAPHVFKDSTRHGGKHEPDSLVKDADWTVLHILAEDKRVLEQLLTTDLFAVPAGRKRKKSDASKRNVPRMPGYLEAYNLTEAPIHDRGFQRTEMPAGQRAGLLTHPAWLVAHSQNFHTDPVRRGKWILGHLLGYDVPELPIAVQAQLPEESHHTIRERFRVVRDQQCWRCHKRMNPLGEIFEAYDDFGRYRDKHLIDSDGNLVESEFEKMNRFSRTEVKSAKPTRDVDTRGELIGTGDSTLDGPVEDPVDLMHRLAKSERVRQVFIRHVFRYWMGRNESLDDSPTLMAMDRAYVKSDGSFRETLVALITSDSFLYRR